MQFSFMAGKGTIDTIFFMRQSSGEAPSKDKKLCYAFVDLDKESTKGGGEMGFDQAVCVDE